MDLKKKRQEMRSRLFVKDDLERLIAGFESKEQSGELHVYNQGLVELQQMTANPVRGSRPAALESSAPFGPLI